MTKEIRTIEVFKICFTFAIPHGFAKLLIALIVSVYQLVIWIEFDSGAKQSYGTKSFLNAAFCDVSVSVNSH